MRTSYLLLFVLAACDPVSESSRSTPDLATHRPSPEPREAPRERASGTSSATANVAECRVDEHGLRVMALVREAGTFARREPGAEPVLELSQFAPPYYVFEQHPAEGRARFHRLGTTPRRDSILGWVEAEKLVLWNSRVGAEPLAEVALFESAELLAASLEGRGSEARAFAVTPKDSSRRPFLWPVAESRRVRVRGEELELLRVHVLVSRMGEDAHKSGVLSPTQARSELGVLDCVVLLDATGSMSPFWKEAQAAVRGLASRLAKAGASSELDVRFRLIAFWDHGDDSPALMRAFELSDEEGFRKNLSSIDCMGGGDTPEAGLEALQSGLDTRWRGGDLSTRLIFLISDSSFHEGPRKDSPARPTREQVLARARDLKVRICGLAVGKAEENQDRQRQIAQYETLSKASGGVTHALAEAQRAVAHVETLLSEASQRIGRRTRVLDELSEGVREPASIAGRTGIELAEVTEILAFLEGGGVDLDGARAGEARLLSGWLPATAVRRKSLISRSELELALAALHSLRADLSPDSARNTFGAAGILRTRPSEALAWLVPDEEQEIALNLAARGIPAGPRSVLRRTRIELAQASEKERASLRDRVSEAIEALWAFRTDAGRWVKRGGEDWAFLDEAVLP